MHTLFILQLIILLSSRNTKAQTTVGNNDKDIASSDEFSKMVSNKFIVDKSPLIKDLYLLLYGRKEVSKCPIKVYAQRNFGKSTNLMMVKRFFEIVVDEYGIPVEVNSTLNYKLFHDNLLEIMNDVEFVKENFGRHPIIYIKCKSLSEVSDFNHLIDTYRNIVMNSFLEHQYLLNVDLLWADEFNKTIFEMYSNVKHQPNVHQYFIICAFNILSKVLYTYFGKKVIVLIDDFDAIEDCPAYENNVDRNRIFDFVKIFNSEVFDSTKYVCGGLLCATLRQESVPSNDINTYHRDVSTKDDTNLWKYFGLSGEELHSFLKRFLKVDKLVKKAENYILESGIYLTGTNRTQLCSVLSAIECIKRFTQ